MNASDAAWVASLFAVDPFGSGGVCLRSQVQPARESWLQLLPQLLPPGSPLKRIPFNIPDGRLLGGLDLAATLKANRPIIDAGILATTDQGVLIVSMAERLSAHTAACLSAALDSGDVVLSREAVHGRYRARVGLVALDEGIGADEFVPAALRDRCAFFLDFDGLGARASFTALHDWKDIITARELLPHVRLADDLLERLCGTALTLGAGSARVSVLAVRVACAVAALEGRARVIEDDAVLAGRLVLAPRATSSPARADEQSTAGTMPPAPRDLPQDPARGDAAPPPSSPPPPISPQPTPGPAPRTSHDDAIEDRVLDAALAAIPAGLLAGLVEGSPVARSRAGGQGRGGNQRTGVGRGRPVGVRSAQPNGNARLNVLETLRAAAPWQRLRGRLLEDARVRVQPGDFRVTTHKQRSRTLTIFVVDASGSAALNRLAEAKGAVELLLGECYVRRDQVAVIAFRGRVAEVLLPPTRSLVRAKRSLAGMAGGGATPLAAALTAAVTLANQALRRGETPTLVLLSDGAANIARDGTAGRKAAHADALSAAIAVRLAKITALLLDISPRPNPLTHSLALAMNARYVPLPYASSKAVSDAVKLAAAGARR